MNRLKSALLSIILAAAASAAHASFTYSLNGPSSLSAGQSGSFDALVSFTPIDLASQPTLGGMVEYINPYARTFLSSVRIFSLQGSTMTYAGEYLFPQSNISIADASSASTTHRGFNLAFEKVGTYLLDLSGQSFEQIYRKRTALCMSDVSGCGSNGALDDSNVFLSASDAYALVNVTAVPEPETFALMLAGLGLIGATVRRKKANLA